MSDYPDFKSTQMSKKQMRRTNLVTYSRANLELFPTRASFGITIAEAFNKGNGKAKVKYFAAALENQKDSSKHYHVAIKLDGSKQCLSVKSILRTIYDIVVNFSCKFSSYVTRVKLRVTSILFVCSPKFQRVTLILYIYSL